MTHIEFKYLPPALRQMVLAELVYCTDPLERTFPGCSSSMDSKAGRREAFWLALCRCVLINTAKLVHCEIVETVPTREDVAVHEPIFKKHQLDAYKFDKDALLFHAGELGNFDSDSNKYLIKALKIGGKQPFVVPVDMVLESGTAAAKAAKALLMMTLPFRLIPEQLGIAPPASPANSEDEDDEGDDSDGEEQKAKRCSIMYVQDSASAATYKTLKKDFKNIRSVFESGGGDMRCIVVTSPPWGVLDNGRADPGGEDEALTADQIATFALGLAELMDEQTVVCLHLPPYDQPHWRKIFESTGKWEAYLHPVVVVSASSKGLTYFNKYQHANNVFTFLCFHRADYHPLVTSDFLREKPGMAKLMNTLWNTGTVIPAAAVPKAERVMVKVEKKLAYMRTQQVSASVMRPLIRMYGRALKEQEPMVIVDPFMGSGSTALAARQLGCGFIGWDRDANVVSMAKEKFEALKQVLTRSYTV